MRNSSTIKAKTLPTVEGLGYELWGCVHLTQGHRSTLRVYIDSKQGITVEECARVSRQIRAVLDVENPSLAQYSLDVSSPGLNRPLFTADQYQRFIGYSISIQTATAIDNQRRFRGLLKSTSEDGVVLGGEDGAELVLTWDNIMRANVLPEIIK